MSAKASPRSFEEACTTLGSRLRARFPEIEAGLANLVDGVPAPGDPADPTYREYLNSLHEVRPAVLGYNVDVIELGEWHAPDIPPIVFAAARLAARADVPLDTVLRRYSAGNAFFGDILVEEAEQARVSPSTLRRLLHRQTSAFDRLIEAVGAEHTREAQSRPTTTAEWRHEYIEELLAGRRPSGEMELDYDLDGHHLGLMASGKGSDDAIRRLAKRLDRRLLIDRREEEQAWACWIGGRRPLRATEVMETLGEILPDPITVALGEPAEGVTGWRLSHRQAKAALPIAEHRGESILRYADVAVLVSILRDNLGNTSLRELYLKPLEGARDGGRMQRETLRAYFAGERNVSSTAAALGVDRRTVTNRIRAIEKLFGRPLSEFAADLETALRLVAD